MQTGNMFLIVALALLASFFLFGCAQASFPEVCRSVSASKMANCIYVNAVLEQNPFHCYSIEDLNQRGTCMKHATDPAMRKAVQNAQAQDLDAIFAEPKAEPAQAPAASANITEPGNAPCTSMTGLAKDNCFKTEAINSKSIVSCEKVADGSLRSACIAEVAKKTKDIESCKTLTDEESRSLCRLYAKGETPAG